MQLFRREMHINLNFSLHRKKWSSYWSGKIEIGGFCALFHGRRCWTHAYNVPESSKVMSLQIPSVGPYQVWLLQQVLICNLKILRSYQFEPGLVELCWEKAPDVLEACFVAGICYATCMAQRTGSTWCFFAFFPWRAKRHQCITDRNEEDHLEGNMLLLSFLLPL